MASKPTVQLPDLPDDWYQTATGGPVSSPPSGTGGGILDGVPAREWSLADSGLNLVMSPDEIQTIDFSGMAPQEPPPWPDRSSHGTAAQPTSPSAQSGGEGFHTGLTSYQPDPDAPRMFHPGLNLHGYIPQPSDAGPLARVIYAEGSNTPQDMDALGWAVVNRVGDREFGPTLDAVIHKKGAFQSVQENSPQWQGSANPDALTGPNARAWQRAQDTAQGILDGTVSDPVNGAPYFFAKPNYNGTSQDAPGKSYQRMLADDRIAPVYPPRITGTANYFFNRNPYPPKR